jgi:hypothetical protein
MSMHSAWDCLQVQLSSHQQHCKLSADWVDILFDAASLLTEDIGG